MKQKPGGSFIKEDFPMVGIKHLCWLSLVLILAGTGTARAEERPTDPYTGEVITWDIHGVGEEELAGLPENQGRDQSVEEQIQDQFDVLKQIYRNESAAETDGRATTTCRLEIPDYEAFELNQSNVTVILRGDGGTETFTLYRQSGFKTVEQLKVGRYSLVSAKTIDGSMIFRMEAPWIEVTSSGENVFSLYPGKGNITTSDITISSDLATVEDVETGQENNRTSIVIIILIVMITLIVISVSGGIMIMVIRKKKDRYS